MADRLPSALASRDTSPLELEQLSDRELGVLLSIERRFDEMRVSASEGERQRTAKSYLAPVQVRYPRVLLLDGGRGTGKTSMLLTLVQRWTSENEAGIPRHDADPAAYEERVRRVHLRQQTQGDRRDFSIPDYISVVGRILDFDPLPPEMPLIAGILQAWQPLAQFYDDLLRHPDDYDDEGDTLMDLWRRLFRVAAVGWTAIPRSHGLIEQVLDRQEQVADWQRLDEQWQAFVEAVIERGRRLPKPHRLSEAPVFAIMIDDVDLQVERMRELLPALRLLYHPSVAFVVAAHREHMLDMLALQFTGQQNRLTGCRMPPEEHEPWPRLLAEASVEKVFPRMNRWQLEPLSLLELLEYPNATETIRTRLNGWRKPGARGRSRAIGDYLHRMATLAEGLVDLPPLMTYRSAQQAFVHTYAQHPADTTAVGTLYHLLGASTSYERVSLGRRGASGYRLEYVGVGEVYALFGSDFIEPTSGQSEIVLSARPAFRIDLTSPDLGEATNSRAELVPALIAASLREDGYGVDASGLRWNARLALAWTRVWRGSLERGGTNHNLSFQWRLHEHPSPHKLLEWTKRWGEFVDNIYSKSEDRLDRIAYAWIYYNLAFMGSGVDALVEPMDDSFNRPESWDQLLGTTPPGGMVSEVRWRTQTLPLLARPELGLNPSIQERLLRPIQGNAELEVWLFDFRRRLVTDAFLDAAEELGIAQPDAEDSRVVERTLVEVERQYMRSHGVEDSPWYFTVERQVFQRRDYDRRDYDDANG